MWRPTNPGAPVTSRSTTGEPRLWRDAKPMTTGAGTEPDLTVAICTRDRPEQLSRALDALRHQTLTGLPVLVVDQTADAPALDAHANGGIRLEICRDTGTGLSRGRNIALRRAATEWIAFVDDDCVPEPDWAEQLVDAIRSHPDVALVSGEVIETALPGGDYLPVALFPVPREGVRRGRFTHPGAIAFGVCFAVRRSVAVRLGGWDERLGPGVAGFPAADDMDFNYRLLRSGARTWVTPRVRARHEQWRARGDLPRLYGGYLAAWSGFAMKQLRTGDVAGGAWLWLIGAIDVLHMAASAVRRRSRLRAAVALAKLRGLGAGTARGATTRW